MGKRKDINSEKISPITSLLEMKMFSFRDIARREKVSHQTVSRINQANLANKGQVENKRQNCGRKRKTTPRTDHRIVNQACEKRFSSLRSLHQDLQEEGIHVSQMTLRRRHYEANLRSRRPAKKPKLTAGMKKARLEFAKRYWHCSVDDWKKVNKI